MARMPGLVLKYHTATALSGTPPQQEQEFLCQETENCKLQTDLVSLKSLKSFMSLKWNIASPAENIYSKQFEIIIPISNFQFQVSSFQFIIHTNVIDKKIFFNYN